MTIADRLEAVVARLERIAASLEQRDDHPTGPALSVRHQTADELRFLLHLEQHGCARDGRGFAYCDEAMALFRNLPPEQQLVIG